MIVTDVPCIAVAWLAVPFVTVIAWGAVITTVIFSEVSPTLFVAVTVKGNDPAVVGVPDNTPVVALKVKPGGIVPPVIDHDISAGTPVASNVKL